jgi:putative ABC transport system permease protein
VVGRIVRLDGEQWTIVGVVPDDAQIIGRASIWALLSIGDAPPRARGVYPFAAIGRMKPGVTREAAAADMAAVARGLAAEFPKTNEGRGVALEPLDEAVIGRDLRQTSVLFLGVVGFVLLICCANVANLLLARATVRQRELAVRSALGASRPRVIRQLLTESVLLSMLGGGFGLAVAAAILNAAPLVIPPELLPPTVTLALDPRVAAFCAATALFVGILFGLAPSWRSTGISAAEVIAGDSRTSTGRGGRLRSLLVVGEVATAAVLLVGAGLLLRTLLQVEGVDRGYRAGSVLTMLLDPMSTQYPSDAAELQFYEAVAGEVMGIPGVRDVAWATTLPLGPSYEGSTFFEIVGDPPVAEHERQTADYQIVSPSYFPTLELPVVAGRAFDNRDRAGSGPVCLVNEAFVRGHLQGRSPIGVRVALRRTVSPDERAIVREIVGVVRQVKGRPDEPQELVQIYVPLAQDTPGDVYMLVRPASGDAVALAPAVRAAVYRIDREQLVGVRGVMTLDEIAREATSRHRFRAVLVMAFAALALVLAMVGLFGILAYAVQQRMRDFGVRRALGATTGDVFRLVAGSAARVIAAGMLIGLALAALGGRLLATMLFGVEPLDWPTFAGVIVLVAATAALSAAGPAWRAARIDPAVALRAE